MIKWEYINVNIKTPSLKKRDSVISEECNKYGEEGWELVGFQLDLVIENHLCLIFKRPKED